MDYKIDSKLSTENFYDLLEMAGSESRVNRFTAYLKEILEVYPLGDMTLSEARKWLIERGDKLRSDMYNKYVTK